MTILSQETHNLFILLRSSSRLLLGHNENLIFGLRRLRYQSMTQDQSKLDHDGVQKWVKNLVYKICWRSQLSSSYSPGNEFSLRAIARGTLTVGLEENTLAPRTFSDKKTTIPRSMGGSLRDSGTQGQQEPASTARIDLSGMIIY